MPKTLFLGNGINKLTNLGIGWDDVLNDLASEVDGTKLLKHKDYVPFTLIYEGFSSKSSENSKRGITPLKKKVAKLLRKMEFNPFHKQVMDLGINHIITTNYDYSLENSISNFFKPENFRKESRYSIFRRAKVGNTNKKVSPFRKNYSNFESSDLEYSWGDVFLRDEIHIVGFSLDYSEIDIWWLLTFKAQYESRYKITCGPTIFHYWSDKLQDEKDMGKIELLKSLKVRVDEKFGINYEKMYVGFFKRF